MENTITIVNIKELELQTIDNNYKIMNNFIEGMTTQMHNMHEHLNLAFENFSMQPELIECCKDIIDIKEKVVKIAESVLKLNDLFNEKSKKMKEKF